jgi:hypothetical protein
MAKNDTAHLFRKLDEVYNGLEDVDEVKELMERMGYPDSEVKEVKDRMNSLAQTLEYILPGLQAELDGLYD